MSKDRRLGRGLAALLGTPIDEIGPGNESADRSESSPSTIPFPPAREKSGAATSVRTETATSTPPSETVAHQRVAMSPAERQDMLRKLNQDAHVASATVGSKPEAVAGSIVGSGRAVLEILVDLIDNNPFQPRRQFNSAEIESLAESLKEHEQLQPILVRRMGDRYQLISGERRLRAARHAGMAKIRAEIRQADDRLVAELAIIENLQRKDLNAIEKALSFKRYLHEHKCTQEDLAKRLKIDRSTIANMMRLLELPDSILDLVQREELSAGHARSLLPLGDDRQQKEFARRIIEEGWNVRDTERNVAEAVAKEDAEDQGFDGAATRRKNSQSKSQHIANLEQELKMMLGTKVEIKPSPGNHGKIVIHFSNAEEFERLRQSMSPSRRAAS